MAVIESEASKLEIKVHRLEFGLKCFNLLQFIRLQFPLFDIPRFFSFIQSSRTKSMGQVLGCIQAGQSTVAISERFGKFNDVLDPGCHCVPWCLGNKVAGHLSLQVQQLDVRCETKTKDNVFVTVVASVRFRAMAENATNASYKLSNTREQIQAHVFDGTTCASVLTWVILIDVRSKNFNLLMLELPEN